MFIIVLKLIETLLALLMVTILLPIAITQYTMIIVHMYYGNLLKVVEIEQ